MDVFADPSPYTVHCIECLNIHVEVEPNRMVSATKSKKTKRWNVIVDLEQLFILIVCVSFRMVPLLSTVQNL